MITSEQMTNIYNKETKVNSILPLQDILFTACPKRDLEKDCPSSFKGTDHVKKMLMRYVVASKAFGEGEKIIDAGSGYGWGSYLMSYYASSVVAIEKNKSAWGFSKKTWFSKNITWLCADLFQPIRELIGSPGNLLTCMEVIEHFTKEEGIELIKTISDYLHPGGVLSMSSAFPETLHQAEIILQKNPYHHKYIWTRRDIIDVLSKKFYDITIIDGWILFARKK